MILMLLPRTEEWQKGLSSARTLDSHKEITMRVSLHAKLPTIVGCTKLWRWHNNFIHTLYHESQEMSFGLFI